MVRIGSHSPMVCLCWGPRLRQARELRAGTRQGGPRSTHCLARRRVAAHSCQRETFFGRFRFFSKGDPLVAEIPQPNLVAKSADFSKISKKKKKNFFFSQVFLRPAHYTLGTLLGPKSQKKHELGCFEHLEFIPQPFSVPPVHFVWASALSKNRKISKKKKFFFGKISTTEVGLWAPKNAKKCKNRVF